MLSKQTGSRVPFQSFGEALAYFRKRRGFTQKELANRVGLTSSESVSRYERGEREPRLTSLLELARALQISPRMMLPEGRYALIDGAWPERVFSVLVWEADFSAAEAEVLVRVLEALAEQLQRVQVLDLKDNVSDCMFSTLINAGIES